MDEYRVVVTEQVSRQLNEVADWIEERAPQTAQEWFDNVIAKINSLATFPRRCSRARESSELGIEVRELLLGDKRSWRALFTIRGNDVVVMCIRHVSQRGILPEELFGDRS